MAAAYGAASGASSEASPGAAQGAASIAGATGFLHASTFAAAGLAVSSPAQAGSGGFSSWRPIQLPPMGCGSFRTPLEGNGGLQATATSLSKTGSSGGGALSSPLGSFPSPRKGGNVAHAVSNLSRGSSPGVDGCGIAAGNTRGSGPQLSQRCSLPITEVSAAVAGVRSLLPPRPGSSTSCAQQQPLPHDDAHVQAAQLAVAVPELGGHTSLPLARPRSAAAWGQQQPMDTDLGVGVSSATARSGTAGGLISALLEGRPCSEGPSRGQQLLAELEAELAELDNEGGASGEVGRWQCDLESVLGRIDNLQTGYQVLLQQEDACDSGGTGLSARDRGRS